MATKTNPAPRAAGRAGDTFESLAASNGLQIPCSPLTLQSDFVARRFGLSAEMAAIAAIHAFANGRRLRVQYLARLGLSGAIAALIAERAFTVEAR
jgi:hypothetical protein